MLDVYCDANATFGDVGYFSGYVQGTDCAPYVEIISPYGCAALSVNEIWTFLAQYEYYFGAFFIVIGFLLCFFGRRMIKPSVCIAGFLTTIFATLLFFYTIWLNQSTDIAEFWYFLGGSALVGILIGLLLAKFVKVGAAILAGWGGFAGGLILYETILFRAGQDWLFWVSCAICAGVAAVLTFFFFDHIVIISTVLIGSYALIRGVSMYAGHYYNEFTMAKMVKDGLLEDIDPWYWAYVLAFVVFCIAGGIWQYHVYKKDKKKEEAKKHPYAQK